MKATLALIFTLLCTNLGASTPLGCVSLDEVSSSNNPADIFAGLTSCMDKQNYKHAAALYTMATLYGVYDARRVANEAAPQVVALLRMYALSGRPKAELNRLQAEVVELLTDNTEVCQRILKIGKPAYYPSYITEHISANSTGSLQITEGFNEQEAWQESLALVPHC
ncbi:hypothetical protein [Pseudidiomarina sp.]|uniref:hypothetical protein n=1 Tax=Pseudidiomarina sp. TaxID=2081707 RepID=UPI00299D3DEF|nr:hypothetical protein [Pseudidiomarina sp.]MDX1706372.1 hypothetical protein [Pseudidiomarina sp.]